MKLKDNFELSWNGFKATFQVATPYAKNMKIFCERVQGYFSSSNPVCKEYENILSYLNLICWQFKDYSMLALHDVRKKPSS